MNRRHGFLALLFCTCWCFEACAQTGVYGAKEADYNWWREARFGIFIHWGPGSVIYRHGWGREVPKGHPGTKVRSFNARNEPVPPEIFNGEYLKYADKPGRVPAALYDNLYRVFNPTRFNAEEWVKTFKEAGAGYIVFTTKHLDGFCMFDNPYTDYDVMSTPFKRDICRELAAACHKADLPILWYYLSGDEYDDRFDISNPKPYEDYLYHSVETLLSKYGKIAGIWWDGGAGAMDLDVARIYNVMGRLQPGLIYNGRFAGAKTPGVKFSTPEQRLGTFNTKPWETCAVIQDSAWFWNGGKNIKSLNTCLRMLIDCAGGDGNLLLDFGPCPDGTIYPPIQERFLGMGQWLKKCGKSIYQTRGGPYKPGLWGVSTRSRRTVYLHVTQRWPIGELVLPGLDAKVVSWKALTGGNPAVEQSKEHLTVRMAPAEHAQPDTIIVLTLDRSAMDIEPIDTLSGQASLTTDAKVVASSSQNPASARGAPETVVQYSFESGEFSKQYGEDSDDTYAVQGKGKESTSIRIDSVRIKKIIGSMHRGHFWRFWSPKAEDAQPWIEVDLGKAQTFSHVKLTEQYSKIQGYQLQYYDGRTWKTFDSGNTIDDFVLHLKDPIAAQRVRLLVTKTNGAPPEIVAFDLFGE